MSTPRKYTTAELAQLFDQKDWTTLWKIMTPMVKHTVRRCMQDGLDPFYVRDDLMQEAFLAAWEALPRWNAFEGSLHTWIRENVRGAVLKANTRAVTGMIGGRDSGPLVVSMHSTTPEDDGGNDEQGVPRGPEAKITYENPPEGFQDPAEQSEAEELLAQVPIEDRDMVRRLCGIGVPAETQEEYAVKEGTTPGAVKMRLHRLRKNLVTFSRKTGNQVMRAA